jgi:hypothetical protein
MHLKYIHGITKDEYLDRFPDAELTSLELSQFISEGMYTYTSYEEACEKARQATTERWAGMSIDERLAIGDRISESLQGNTNRLGKPKSREECEAISQGLVKYYEEHPVSEETRKAIGRATNERLADPEYYRRFCESMQEVWDRPGYREMMSELQRKKWEDPEYREMMRKANEPAYRDPARGERISEAVRAYYEATGNREAWSKYWKRRWAEDKFYQKAQAEARNRRPNNKELLLNEFLQTFFPGEWKLVGNGEVVIGGKCPDFINVNGKKKLIEYFGGWHWHGNPFEGEERQAHFKSFGFDTLIIWGSELKESYKFVGFCKLLNKLEQFLDRR